MERVDLVGVLDGGFPVSPVVIFEIFMSVLK